MGRTFKFRRINKQIKLFYTTIAKFISIIYNNKEI